MKKTAFIIATVFSSLLLNAQEHYVFIEDRNELFSFGMDTISEATITLNGDTRTVKITYINGFNLFRDKFIVEDDYEVHSIVFRNGIKNRAWDYKKAIIKGYDAKEDLDTIYILALK